MLHSNGPWISASCIAWLQKQNSCFVATVLIALPAIPFWWWALAQLEVTFCWAFLAQLETVSSKDPIISMTPLCLNSKLHSLTLILELSLHSIRSSLWVWEETFDCASHNVNKNGSSSQYTCHSQFPCHNLRIMFPLLTASTDQWLSLALI